jgi:transposase
MFQVSHDEALAYDDACGGTLGEDASEDDLYAAMDWLLERKGRIEKKLAQRHLADGATVLYDVTSSYYEGRTCPWAKFGHDRDGQKGLPIIVYGVMTDDAGRPVSVEVYEGNTGDPTTVADQADKLRQKFGLSSVVLVGDRGMLTQTQIKELKKHPGLGWITALRSAAIRKLADSGALQLSLFDEKNLAEIASPDFPGERLVVCYNPLLAADRRRKREELLQATEKGLAKLGAGVARRTKTPMKQAEIGVKAGKILGRYKVAKHFALEIRDGSFEWARRQDAIRKESELDGIYVIRTSEPLQRLTAENTVRSYKSLSQVEHMFRCLKGLDLLVRPIRHRTEERVPAHIFLCMLGYYVEWHMRQALAPILFEDEELEKDRKRRDPVLPAKPSESVKMKKRTHMTADGFTVHDFDSLLAELATHGRVTYRMKSKEINLSIKQQPNLTPLQKRAYELLGLLPVNGK